MYLNVKQWYEFAKFRAFRAFVSYVSWRALSTLARSCLTRLCAFAPYLPLRLTYPDFYMPYLRAVLMHV